MGRVYVKNQGVFKVQAKRVDIAIEAALNELGAVAEGAVKERISDDKDSRGFTGRVASGSTRQAVKARRARKTARGYEQVTEYVAPHEKIGIIIEKGRKPGKGVSESGQGFIQRWARRKLGPVKAAEGKRFKAGGREKAEQSRAYLIARAIKKRGIPALAPMKKAAQSLRSGRAQRIYTAALRRYKGASR